MLLKGKELFLRTRYVELLREAAQKEGHEVEVLRFDGNSGEPAEVLDECRSFGLMSAYKIVVVDEADAFATGDARKAMLERYLEAPTEECTLVFRADSWRHKRLENLIQKIGVVIACDALNPAQAVGWAQRKARDGLGRELSHDAATLLVERVGTDLSRLGSEIAKLYAARGASEEPISVEEVRTLVGLTREETAWIVRDAVLSGDPEFAVQKVRDLVTLSRVSPVPLMIALVDLASALHAASRAQESGGSANAALKSRRLFGGGLSAASRAVGSAPSSSWARLLDACLSGDADGKSGRGDAKVDLEVLAARFASLVGGRADTFVMRRGAP